MLDLNNPMARWIMAASREEDAVLHFAKLMTLLPTSQRMQLMTRVQRPLAKLRHLNEKRFGGSSFIASAISDLEAGLMKLSLFESDESKLDGQGNCPVCGHPITDLQDHHDMTYCSQCLDVLANARQRLESTDGFGTFAI